MKKDLIFLFLILILSLPLVLPFLSDGYFSTHDGEWAIVRQGAMHRALIARHFPVRWAGNLNFAFGYPLFLFTYPLPYYLGEIFYILGFGLVNSIKILFILSVLFSGVAMFLLGKEVYGSKGGLLAALFYLYVPYRFVDLFVRGSIGESLAFILFPLLFYLLLKVKKSSSPVWLGLGAIFLASLLLIHNASALLFMPFLITFAFTLFLKTDRQKRKAFVFKLLLFFILGLGLSAFFLLPALLERKNIALSQIPLADKKSHFVSFSQLIFPSWGYGTPSSKDPFSFQLGWVHLIALILGVVVWFKKKKEKNLSSFLFFFSFLSLVILIFLMLPLSLNFWQKTPLFSEIDFPWRVLGITSFFLSLSLGFLGSSRLFSYLGAILATLAIIFNVAYAKPSQSINFGDDYYFTNEATTTSNNELMPIWVKEIPKQRAQEKVEIIEGEGEVQNVEFNSKKIAFQLNLKKPSRIRLNIHYFPGWRLFIRRKPEVIDYQDNGLIEFSLPQGRFEVNTSFGETPMRLIADLISLSSLLVIIFCIIKNKGVKSAN